MSSSQPNDPPGEPVGFSITVTEVILLLIQMELAEHDRLE